MAMCVRGRTKATYKRHRFNAVGDCKACGEHRKPKLQRKLRVTVKDGFLLAVEVMGRGHAAG